jgi:hypothetical protein
VSIARTAQSLMSLRPANPGTALCSTPLPMSLPSHCLVCDRHSIDETFRLEIERTQAADLELPARRCGPKQIDSGPPIYVRILSMRSESKRDRG